MTGAPTPQRALGVYEVVRSIAKGGMGAVYEVRDPRTGASYAAKRILSADPGARVRFEREAELLARCDRHPGIVKVHAFGRTPDGAPYMILDLVRGETLQDLIAREAPLAFDRAARIARDLALALAAAHAQGVTHRDVKPANVLLDADRGGAPRLTDFGIATASDLERLTRSGNFIGTVAYCSPEQASGLVVGALTDIFSLGAILFEMLAGEPVIQEEEMIAHVRTLASSARLRSVTAVRRDVPSSLAAIVARALEKDPASRHVNAAELARELDGFLEGASVGRAGLRPMWLLVLLTGVLALLLTRGVRLAGQPAPLIEPPATERPPDARRRLAADLEVAGDASLANGRAREALEAYGRAMDVAPTVRLRAKHADAADRAGLDALVAEDLSMLAKSIAAISPERERNVELAPLAGILYRRGLGQGSSAARARDLETAWRLAAPPRELVPSVAHFWVERFVAIYGACEAHAVRGGLRTLAVDDPRFIELLAALECARRAVSLDPTAETGELWTVFTNVRYSFEIDRDSPYRVMKIRRLVAAWPGHPALLRLAACVDVALDRPESRARSLSLLVQAAERLPATASYEEVAIVARQIVHAFVITHMSEDEWAPGAVASLVRAARVANDAKTSLELARKIALARENFAAEARALLDDATRDATVAERPDLAETYASAECATRLAEGRRAEAVAWVRARGDERYALPICSELGEWAAILELGQPLPSNLRAADARIVPCVYRALLELDRADEARALFDRVAKEWPELEPTLRGQDEDHRRKRSERR